MALACSQCGSPLPAPRQYLGQWMCSRECSHAAGDRSGCLGWNCGCTAYAKMRRFLRDHRVNMRVMEELIFEEGLEEELEDRLVDFTGNTNFFLGFDANLDESSDAEDPEQQLRATIDNLRSEAADVQHFVDAAAGALQQSNVLLELERTRMKLEDMQAASLRSQ